jgi:hypothetical protein
MGPNNLQNERCETAWLSSISQKSFSSESRETPDCLQLVGNPFQNLVTLLDRLQLVRNPSLQKPVKPRDRLHYSEILLFNHHCTHIPRQICNFRDNTQTWETKPDDCLQVCLAKCNTDAAIRPPRESAPVITAVNKNSISEVTSKLHSGNASYYTEMFSPRH